MGPWSCADFWFKRQAEQAQLAGVCLQIQGRVNLPCSNRIAARKAMSHLQHLGGDHVLNECIYKTPAGRAVSGAQGGSLSPHPCQQCHQWERQKALGTGQGDREAGNSCCKQGAREEGAALRKEEEGMKERRRYQWVPGHVTQSGAETG